MYRVLQTGLPFLKRCFKNESILKLLTMNMIKNSFALSTLEFVIIRPLSMTTGDDNNGPHMIQNPDGGFCEGNKSVMLVT